MSSSEILTQSYISIVSIGVSLFIKRSMALRVTWLQLRKVKYSILVNW
jgi:hypothetical protein